MLLMRKVGNGIDPGHFSLVFQGSAVRRGSSLRTAFSFRPVDCFSSLDGAGTPESPVRRRRGAAPEAPAGHADQDLPGAACRANRARARAGPADAWRTRPAPLRAAP